MARIRPLPPTLVNQIAADEVVAPGVPRVAAADAAGPFHAPRSGPYLRNAPMKYSLQLGVNRHTDGSTRRRHAW
jgi:hypothetical protein